MTHDLAAMRITQETEDQVMALIAQLEALLPGMVALPAGDRDRPNTIAPKSESYVRITMELANQNADMIPPYVDLASANADLEARDRMLRITQRVRQLGDRCEDTTCALGRHLMVFAQVCCAVLKILGKSAGSGDGNAVESPDARCVHV